MADFGLTAILGAVGTIASGVATIAGGQAAQQAAEMQAAGQRHAAAAQQANLNYQAKQIEMKGKEEQAAAQREGFAKKREKDQALSALQARSAASGFTATDPTVLQLGSEIEKYGTLQQMMAAYGGKSRRAGLDAEAVGRRAEGRSIVQGADYSARGTILGGRAEGFSRFASGIGSFASGFGSLAKSPMFSGGSAGSTYRYG